MKKNSLTLLILLLITSFIGINAQENENISYNYALNWLCIDTQFINEPILNAGANVAGKTFKATDFFETIKMPNNSRPSKGRKAYDNTNSPSWKFVSTSKSGFFVSTSNDNNSQYS